ncbi:MAG: hypothetical protein HKM95_06465 [Inquilinus sp.]|nr:hypothetical protein [Inquilinus sp.]
MNNELIATAGDVIIEGVKVGLDVAGEHLLGPTAWKYFKRIVQPVIRRLQRRHPALAFGCPNDEQANLAAQSAVEELQSDSELQHLLETNFENLEHGQQEIRIGITRIQRIVTNTSEQVGQISIALSEIRRELGKRDEPGGSDELPSFVDISDYVNHYDMLTRAYVRREGMDPEDRFARRVIPTAVFYLDVVHFEELVLEYGEPFKLYKTNIKGHVVTADVSRAFVDKIGRECRTLRTTVPNLIRPEMEFYASNKTCIKEEGGWRCEELQAH